MAKEPKPEKETEDAADAAPKAEKAAKAPKAEKAPKGEKPEKGEKAPKGEKPAKGEKEPKGKGKKEKEEKPSVPAPPPRLQVKYEKEIVPVLAEKLGRKNRNSLPRLQKIVINMGVGEATQEKKYLEAAVDAMGQIAGQKPVQTLSRQAVSAFRLRENMPIGCMVTLRKQRMYEFLDRLISIALPRVRDFRGINRMAFDGNGNYSMGLSEQLVFPELNPDKFTRVQGMNIAIVISNSNNDESRELLTLLGMPFQAVEEASGKGK
ncbi:MAG: 50S ribosomal protein L5 [Pirellulaceae bacterium]